MIHSKPTQAAVFLGAVLSGSRVVRQLCSWEPCRWGAVPLGSCVVGEP